MVETKKKKKESIKIDIQAGKINRWNIEEEE